MKNVFLYVYGSDYSALEFERNYNAQEFYESMVERGITELTIASSKIEFTVVKIVEFDGEIQDEILHFIKDRLCDYDDLKGTNLYKVKYKE